MLLPDHPHILTSAPYAVDISSVCDGQTCSSSIRRIPFAGHDLSSLLSDLLAARGGPRLATTLPQWSGLSSGSGGGGRENAAGGRGDAEILKMMCAAVSESSADHDAMMGGARLPGRTVGEGPDTPLKVPGEPQTYTLPDGQQVTITTEGYQVGQDKDSGAGLNIAHFETVFMCDQANLGFKNHETVIAIYIYA